MDIERSYRLELLSITDETVEGRIVKYEQNVPLASVLKGV